MLKNTLLLVSIVLVSLAIIFSAYILKDKDICCGLSFCKNFTDICNENDSNSYTVLTSVKGTELKIKNLKSGDTVVNGSTIEGEVKGSWYWEGIFPVQVIDLLGNEILVTNAVAQGEWTTDNPVPFKIDLTVPVLRDSDIILVFRKSNASGSVENDDNVSIRLLIEASQEDMVVKVYFLNANMGSSEDCTKVFPVTRVVVRDVAIARVALEQLINGPTEKEIEDGYYSNVNENVEIQELSIANGVAKVDFSNELAEGVGGSCMVESIRSQIDATLKQFPTVNDVELSIDGVTEDILQP